MQAENLLKKKEKGSPQRGRDIWVRALWWGASVGPWTLDTEVCMDGIFEKNKKKKKSKLKESNNEKCESDKDRNKQKLVKGIKQ